MACLGLVVCFLVCFFLLVGLDFVLVLFLRENVFTRPAELVGEGEGSFGMHIFINIYMDNIHIYTHKFFSSLIQIHVLSALLPSVLKIERNSLSLSSALFNYIWKSA